MTSADYSRTAPMVSPVTNWRWANQPMMTTGSTVAVAAADMLAQNRPSEVLNDAI